MSSNKYTFLGDLTPVLSSLMGNLSDYGKVVFLFNTFLGRNPDDDAIRYYSERLSRSHAEIKAVIIEIATSEEAENLGLMNAAANIILSSEDESMPVTLSVLAACGVLFRQLSEQSAKFSNIEQLAKLTLLSVPEWCGQAYEQLNERVDRLEAASDLKSLSKSQNF